MRLVDEITKLRFWRDVAKTQAGCWMWNGVRDSKGYGQFALPAGRHTRADLAAFETVTGLPVPEGHILHHSCGARSCVSPWHLVPLQPGDVLEPPWLKDLPELGTTIPALTDRRSQ